MKHRLTFPAIERMFPDEDTAEQWFIEARWQGSIRCVHCGSDRVNRYKPQVFRCRDCRKFFSTKTGTALHSSNLSYRQLVIAVHLLTTRANAPIAELHLNLGVSPITAWRMANLINELWMEKEGND